MKIKNLLKKIGFFKIRKSTGGNSHASKVKMKTKLIILKELSWVRKRSKKMTAKMKELLTTKLEDIIPFTLGKSCENEAIKDFQGGPFGKICHPPEARLGPLFYSLAGEGFSI